MIGEGDSNVLARVARLTSNQIADRILETDRAALLDSLGYFDRRISWIGNPAYGSRVVVREPGGVLRPNGGTCQ